MKYISIGMTSIGLTSIILAVKHNDVIAINGIDLVFKDYTGNMTDCYLMNGEGYLRLNDGTQRALFHNRQEMADAITNNRYIIDGVKTKMIDPLTRIENAEKELALAKEALIQAKKDAEPRWYDGMPVLVRDGLGYNWTERYLKSVLPEGKHGCDGKYEAYKDGNITGGTTKWVYCKPNYDAPSRLTWIPNTGVRPKAIQVFVKFSNGVGAYTHPNSYNWARGASNEIVEYAILVKE